MTWVMAAISAAFLLAAGVTALFGEVRRTVWLCVSVAVFIATGLYWSAGLPSPVVVSAVADAAVCVALYAFAKEKWELALWRMFQLFVMVHILYLAGVHSLAPRTDYLAYSLVIEAINLAIIGMVLGTGIMQRAYNDAGRYRADRPVCRLVRALRSERASPPFWTRKA